MMAFRTRLALVSSMFLGLSVPAYPQLAAYRTAAIGTAPSMASVPASPDVYPANIREARLVSPGVGWAATEDHLYWTENGGTSWLDISPPHSGRDRYASIFFLNAHAGWVLFAHQIADNGVDTVPGSNESDWTFYVTATSDGGRTWNTILLPAMKSALGSNLSDKGQVAFADAMHGWIDVHHSLTFGSLLATADGGQTWKWVTAGPSSNADISAPSAATVLLAGADARGNSSFYASYDDGNTFHSINLQPPPSVLPAASPTYTAPIFENATTGYEAVTFSGGPGVASAAVLYQTHNGGRTWTADRTISNLAHSSVGERISFAIADSTWIVPLVQDHNEPKLLTIAPQSNLAEPQNQGSDWGACALSFIRADTGWSVCSLKLRATSDSGGSWTDITPHLRAGSLTSAPLTVHRASTTLQPHITKLQTLEQSLQVTPATGSLYPAGTEQYLAFDATRVPTVDQMSTLWQFSPYNAVGIYVPGSPNRGTDNNLGPSWLDSVVHQQGWGVIPIWYGLQAPCVIQTGLQEFSSDPATAYQEGQSMATSAYSNATNATTLGLDGSIMYLDIENTNNTCGTAIQAYLCGFLSAYTHGSVGVYGSITDAPNIYNPKYQGSSCGTPTAFWLTRADNRATVWNMDHGNYVGNLPDSEWNNYQRAHQYDIQKQTDWGGVSFGVDEDVIDATIVAGQGPSPKAFPSATAFTINYSNNPSTLTSIENGASAADGFTQGTLVGFYTPTTTPPFENGFQQGASGSPTQITYTDPPNQVFLTEPMGTNNIGQVVGYYQEYQGAITNHGFLYSPATGYQTVDVPGATETQLVSINDAGWITAIVSIPDDFYSHCALMRPIAGSYQNQPLIFDEPMGNCAWASINGLGEIVGEAQDENSGTYYPFFEDVEDGTPGSGVTLASTGSTYVQGINNNGVIAGGDSSGPVIMKGTQYDNMLADPSAGLYGVNDDLEMVGGNSSGGLLLDTPH